MAVTRIIAPAKWHRRAAELTKGDKRLSRELTRAAERPGRTAELTLDEAYVLLHSLPDDPRVQDAVRAGELAQARELNRPTARELAGLS